MRFWIREIAGWLLVLAGLYFFLMALSLVFASPSWPLSSIAPTTIGIFVFRGGIHLLKVAMAARVALAYKPVSIKPSRTPAVQSSPPRRIQEDW